MDPTVLNVLAIKASVGVFFLILGFVLVTTGIYGLLGKTSKTVREYAPAILAGGLTLWVVFLGMF